MKSEDLVPYDTFRADVLARLDAELGARPWSTPLGDGIDWAGTTDPEGDRAVAVMPLYEAPGTYPTPEWPRVSEIVAEAAVAHGFAELRVDKAEPGALVLVGLDDLGGSFRFEMEVNTVLRVYVDRTPQVSVTPVSS